MRCPRTRKVKLVRKLLINRCRFLITLAAGELLHMASILRDVAQHAGVSLATASRVASGSASVRAETRDGSSARCATCSTSRRAPRPRRERSACSCPSSATRSSPRWREAMERARRRPGLPRSSATRPASAFREADYVHMLLERRVDGMIFISSEMTDLRSDHAHYRRLSREGARLVFVNGGSTQLDVTSVGVDERAAGRLATEHLLALGHTRIGFAAGDALPARRARRPKGASGAPRGRGSSRTASSCTPSFTVEGGRAGVRAAARRTPGGRPTGDHLLERPDGDRRAPRSGGPGHARSGRPLGRRLRRDRRGRLDEPALDDGRAADRRDRRDGGTRAPHADRAPGRSRCRTTSSARVSGSAARPRRTPPSLRKMGIRIRGCPSREDP